MNKKVNLHNTIDATVWTKEWLKTIKKKPTIPSDEGTMLGWFANAIMAGFDAGERAAESRISTKNLVEELIKREGVQRIDVDPHTQQVEILVVEGCKVIFDDTFEGPQIILRVWD